MMNLEEIRALLETHKGYLERKYRVKRIGVFGSYARNEQNAGSDVDILVEFYEPIGWEFVDLKEELENILGMPVDLVTVKGLKKRLRDKILKEVVYA